jgi:predicted lipid carrier protein YhbT
LLTALQSVFKENLAGNDFAFLEDKWLHISITDLALNELLI